MFHSARVIPHPRCSRAPLLACTVTLVTFFLWRMIDAPDDWELALLLPQMGLLCSMNYRLSLAASRARLRAVVTQRSILTKLLTGHLRAGLSSLALTVGGAGVLAWGSLQSGWRVPLLASVAGLLATLAYLPLLSWLKRHLQAPFARLSAIELASWTFGLAAVALAVPWVFYAEKTWWGSDLSVVVQHYIEDVQPRSGWNGELWRFLAGLEGAKAWAAHESRNYFGGWLRSIDSALVILLAVRINVVVTAGISVDWEGSDG